MSRLFSADRLAKLVLLVFKLAQAPRIAGYRLLPAARCIGRPVLLQPLMMPGRGTVTFEGCVRIGYFPSPHFFSTAAYLECRYESARINIADGTCLNNNFCAIAEYTSITLGKRVLVGTGVEIFDSDFHGLKIANRGWSDPSDARPVVVEDDVFIGSNVRILKGVTIGAGAVIANSSVVVSDVPAGTLAAGNPARVIRAVS